MPGENQARYLVIFNSARRGSAVMLVGGGWRSPALTFQAVLKTYWLARTCWHVSASWLSCAAFIELRLYPESAGLSPLSAWWSLLLVSASAILNAVAGCASLRFCPA